MAYSFNLSIPSLLVASLFNTTVLQATPAHDDDGFLKSSSSTSSVPPASNPFEAQRNKFPAIFAAINAGDINAIKVQLEKGTPVNTFDADMYTPLMRAAFKGQEDVVKLLLEKGADSALFRGGLPTDTAKGYGMKAIHSAVNGASLNTLKMIVDDLRKKGKTQEIALRDGDGQNVFDKASIRLGDLRKDIRDKSNFLNNNAQFIADKEGHIEKARSFLARGMNQEANQKKINDLTSQIADLTQKKNTTQKALDDLKRQEAKMEPIYAYLEALPEFKGHTPISYSSQ